VGHGKKYRWFRQKRWFQPIRLDFEIRSLKLLLAVDVTSFCRMIACLAGSFALLGSASDGQSQLANGSIAVDITDVQGAAMAGVSVELLNKDNGFSRTVVTNDQGWATGPLLPLGTYDVTVQQAGFAVTKVTDVTLQVGEQRLLNITMKVSTVAVRMDFMAAASRFFRTKAL
jgi:hypothetical protein